MTILIAPNAFKDSLDAMAAAHCIAKGLERALPEARLIIHPVADGGDNTLDTLGNSSSARFITIESRDPLNRKLKARYAIMKDGNALIEMAATSGVHLLASYERKAGVTSSFGTGMLIADAIKKGSHKIFLGVGGTATVDAGTGILRALGFRFLDKFGKNVEEGGLNLAMVETIVPPPSVEEIKKTKIIILSDVTNPLLGREGAAHVFAPQKGASPEEVETLEKSMQHFCRIVEKMTGNDISSMPYGGAAGGVPAGLSAFLNVTCRNGAETILDLTHFDHELEKADLVITGEGKLDSQTGGGKAPMAVATRARAAGKQVLFIGGQVPAAPNDPASGHFDAVFSISPGVTDLDRALANAGEWLERTAYNIGKVLFR